MAAKIDQPVANNEYQSTPEDRRRAQLLGVVYVILAIFLAWMLFKIWPPTPWPTSKELAQNPQLARELRDAECPTPSPTPSASPTPSPQPSNTPATTNSVPTTTPSVRSTVSP